MNIQTVSVRLNQSFENSQDKAFLEVLFDGKPGRLIFLNDINCMAFQTRIDAFHDTPLVEKNGVCRFHKEICRNVVYDKDTQKFFCVVGMRNYQIKPSAETTILLAKWISDSMIIPKSVDAISGIDFLITEDEEVYTAWPTLMSSY